jgi:hypothetical protein
MCRCHTRNERYRWFQTTVGMCRAAVGIGTSEVVGDIGAALKIRFAVIRAGSRLYHGSSPGLEETVFDLPPLVSTRSASRHSLTCLRGAGMSDPSPADKASRLAPANGQDGECRANRNLGCSTQVGGKRHFGQVVPKPLAACQPK